MIFKNGQEVPARKRARVVNPVRLGQTKDLGDMAVACRADPKGFLEKLGPVIAERKMKLEGVNLRDLQRAFKDIEVEAHVQDPDGKQRAVMTSAFPLILGNLVIAELDDLAESIETVGEELVRDIVDAKRVTTVARVLVVGPDVDEVKENVNFPELEASEESYEVLSRRNGRKLSISQEAIDESDTVNIIEKLNKLVEIGSDYVEELTLDRVTDRFGSAAVPREPYALRRRGAALGPLYSATANTPGDRAPLGTRVVNNPLTSTAALDAMRERLAETRNDRGKRIAIPMSRSKLLVPNARLGTILKLVGSELEPGNENELNNWGPRGRWRPAIVSTPRLDDISTTKGWMGDFMKQFVRKVKTDFEYVTLGRDTQRFLDARIAFQARLCWDYGVNAIDYGHVIESTEDAA